MAGRGRALLRLRDEMELCAVQKWVFVRALYASE